MTMPENVFPLDQSKSMFEQEVPGHNRWHPDIPAAATVRPGTDFRMDCREWTDGQVKNTDDANDATLYVPTGIFDFDILLSDADLVSRDLESQAQAT